jgi:ADP-ribose pyrophosphatase YjhB (NUDIX family)
MQDRPGRLRVIAGCGAAVVAPDGRLLIVEQEHDGVREWGYLGGGLEAGESLQECAVREVLEESGLLVRVERLLSVTEYWQDGNILGIGCLFLVVPEPWPQAVALPERDERTRFLGHRWIERQEFGRLQGRAGYDFAGLPWPADVEATVLRRVDQ